MKELAYIKKKKFPPFLDQIIRIDPKDIPITAYARMMCQNCGLWNRAILCPPMLYKTYPMFGKIDFSKNYFNAFHDVHVYIFKNDGSRRFWYKSEHDKYSHLRLRKVKSGRQLKGIEIVSAKWLTRIMRKMRNINEKRGFDVFTMIQGHCDSCGHKCPNRNNPPCERSGLPSMEATGINVYQLLKQLGVEYEYPVETYLTQVTMMISAKR